MSEKRKAEENVEGDSQSKRQQKKMKKDSGNAHLAYLKTWKENQLLKSKDPNATPVWKFNKAQQNYVLHRAFDADKIPDSHFAYLVEYVAPCEGQARQLLLDSCKRVLSIRKYMPEYKQMIYDHKKSFLEAKLAKQGDFQSTATVLKKNLEALRLEDIEVTGEVLHKAMGGESILDAWFKEAARSRAKKLLKVLTKEEYNSDIEEDLKPLEKKKRKVEATVDVKEEEGAIETSASAESVNIKEETTMLPTKKVITHAKDEYDANSSDSDSSSSSSSEEVVVTKKSKKNVVAAPIKKEESSDSESDSESEVEVKKSKKKSSKKEKKEKKEKKDKKDKKSRKVVESDSDSDSDSDSESEEEPRRSKKSSKKSSSKSSKKSSSRKSKKESDSDSDSDSESEVQVKRRSSKKDKKDKKEKKSSKKRKYESDSESESD